MRVFGSAGRAAEVLACCPNWLNVEHVVVYNAPQVDEARLRAVMKEGQRALSAVPGVREVIESYKHHPAHVAFADHLFRPIAADRLTTDYHVVAAHAGIEALSLSSPQVPEATGRNNGKA